MILKFKTNINCGGCIEKVTPSLDELPGLEWHVDTSSPDKIMTVTGGNYPAEKIVEVVSNAGFKIEPVRKKWLGIL